MQTESESKIHEAKVGGEGVNKSSPKGKAEGTNNKDKEKRGCRRNEMRGPA